MERKQMTFFVDTRDFEMDLEIIGARTSDLVSKALST